MRVCRKSILIIWLVLLSVPRSLPVQAGVGDLDVTFAGFGAGGKVVTDVETGNNSAYAVALHPDGKIVIAGAASDAFVVARYHDNGVLDKTFGNGAGYVRTPIGSASRAQAVAIQNYGGIVVAGYTSNAGNNDFAVVRYNADGGVDTSFGGGDGITTTDFEGQDDQARAVAVQSDGKIVAGGFAVVGGDYDFALVRYCANGDLDNGANCPGGFGSGGKVSTGFDYEEKGYGIVLQPDDKIVLAGQRVGSPGADFVLARYCPDGSLDDGSNCGPGGFDGDGKLSTLLVGVDGVRAVALQADGKIIAVGEARSQAGDSWYGLVRYCQDGSRDNGSNCGPGGFGSDGIVTTSITGSDNAQARAVTVRPDGTLVVTGFANSVFGNVFVTVSYTSNGSAGSPVITDITSGDDLANSIALQPDGRAVIAGSGHNGANNDFVLIRFWQDGALDMGGKQTLGFADAFFGPGSRDVANAMALQSDGKIVLAGQISDTGASDTDFALARFFPDGRLDGSFGINGRVTYGFGGDQFARAVIVQPDDKIVVGGYTIAADVINFMIARFNPDGTPDGDFGFGGFYVMDFLGGPDYGVALALAPDGKIVMGGTAYNGARNVFGVARFNEDGMPDLTFDEDGKTLYEFSVGPTHYGSAVVVQPDHKIVLGGHVGADFALVRLTEAGLVDYGFGNLGQTLTDMGGSEYLNAMLLTPDGWFVAAGMRVVNGAADFALAQYDPNGLPPAAGPSQPWAQEFIDWGGDEVAFALDWRSDGQIVAAGCANGEFAWAQLPSSAQSYTPVKPITDFLGNDECAYGVKFAGRNQVLAAGYHTLNGDTNFALARFETIPVPQDPPDPPPYQSFLPLLLR